MFCDIFWEFPEFSEIYENLFDESIQETSTKKLP